MTKEQALQVLQVFVDFSWECFREEYVSCDLKSMLLEIEELDVTEFLEREAMITILNIKKLAEAALNTLKN
jgi:hypothetical protein